MKIQSKSKSINIAKNRNFCSSEKKKKKKLVYFKKTLSWFTISSLQEQQNEVSKTTKMQPKDSPSTRCMATLDI